jgi:hypothetical protein
MFWFKKKNKDAEAAKAAAEASGDDENPEEQKPEISGNVEAELTKIKSSLEALNEVRKANSEQFTRTSEQIGELRGSLMDTNKAVGSIEVASTKAIDMVNSVQPDKLMIEVRKTDGKVEALRANIEANETIMKDMMKEMKDIRAQMTFYKGVDQVVKMNNEIKQELIDIKKTEGMVGKHADRVETIFVEVEKKFYDLEKFSDAVKELDKSFRKISTDFDKIRLSVDDKSEKKDLMKLVDKFADFEKHTSNILKLLDQKSKNTIIELNNSFNSLREQMEVKYNKKIEVKGLSEDAAGPQSKPADAAASGGSPAGVSERNVNVDAKTDGDAKDVSKDAKGDTVVNKTMDKIKDMFVKKSQEKSPETK